jgi:hypothetical protein
MGYSLSALDLGRIPSKQGRVEPFLISHEQFLKAVAQETARMSFPGRMGGVVKAGTKKAVERYFVQRFPIATLWSEARQIARRFDEWHRERVWELGKHLERRGLIKRRTDRSEAVAAKFLNTYLHQLMKYAPCRPLWNHLHLPLDRRILMSLQRLRRNTESQALLQVHETLRKPPYSIRYSQYLQVQRALQTLLKELNRRPGSKVKLVSRIELNLLWVE